MANSHYNPHFPQSGHIGQLLMIYWLAGCWVGHLGDLHVGPG